MRILVCPDAFKGTLTAAEAAATISRPLRAKLAPAEVVELPLADGGPGTLTVLERHLGGELKTCTVRSPSGRLIEARYLRLDRHRAVVEMAEAAGLQRVREPCRDVERSTTFGVGELVRDALSRGAREIVVTLGGSATNDGGVGLAQALGYRFLDDSGRDLADRPEHRFGCAAWLGAIAAIDRRALMPELALARLRAACDVTNPLLGESGATLTYAAQKGASAALRAVLEHGMCNLASVLRRELERDVADRAGAGAAGGLGAGLAAFCAATLISGVDWLFEQIDLAAHIDATDVVVTGEGRVDQQTLHGKTVAGVVGRASRARKPVVVIAGSVGPGHEKLLEPGTGAVIDAACGRRLGAHEMTESSAARLTAAAERAADVIARLPGAVKTR